MATWQSLNGGGLLAGIGSQNNNAPQARDNLQTLGLIQQNNEFTRQGGNNVGLQALQGLGGLASMHQQEQQQKAIGAFNQAHAQAWKTGDNSILREFAATNPAFVAQAQQAVAGLDEQQRNEMGMLAMGANTALAQGPEAFGQYIQQNADGLRRVGADPNWMLQSGMQNPDQLSHLATTLAMGALGPEKAFAVKDKMEGRENDRGKLAESIRSNQASEANTRYGHNISRENSIRSANAPTAAMQNYSMYAQMLKDDPDAAAVFAASAGINPGAKKLMSVQKNDDGTVTKYFTDGSEEAGNASQPISTDGMRKPLTIYQADKILSNSSEGSKASAGFATRLKEGQEAMKQLIDSGQVSPARAAFISKSLGSGIIANNALSPAEQSYMINAQDVVNAILRRDTGAAITRDETIEYGRMYLPQPGDSQKALETKQKKIDGRFKTFRGESGLAYEAMQVSSRAYDSESNSDTTAKKATAPQQAIAALKNNPQLAEQFKAKYGYLP